MINYLLTNEKHVVYLSGKVEPQIGGLTDADIQS